MTTTADAYGRALAGGGGGVKLSTVGARVTLDILGFGALDSKNEFAKPGIKALDRNGREITEVRTPVRIVGSHVDNPPTGDDDDMKRTLYASQNLLSAIGGALTAAGATEPEPGGRLVIWIADTKDVGKGNPLKLYEATYTPPNAAANAYAAVSEPESTAAVPAAGPSVGDVVNGHRLTAAADGSLSWVPVAPPVPAAPAAPVVPPAPSAPPPLLAAVAPLSPPDLSQATGLSPAARAALASLQAD